MAIVGTIFRKIKKLIKLMKFQILAFLLRPPFMFSFYMRRLGTNAQPQQPPVLPYSDILKTQDEIDQAVQGVKACGLYPCLPPSKSWDALAALSIVLRHTKPTSWVLDAGGEYYSTILPWLHSYHYQNLIAVNLCFKKPRYRGRILYRPGDITNLDYPDDFFDAITCQSVIEHHVPLDAYFKEMARVLKPGGVVFTSTDYWDTGIDTKGKQAYGGSVKILDAMDIQRAISIARKYSLQPFQEVDYQCQESPISWMDLNFTFLYFTLRKDSLLNHES